MSRRIRRSGLSGIVLAAVAFAVATGSAPNAPANGNVYVSRFWHNHQPIYWPEWNGNGEQTERVQYAWDSIVLKPSQYYGTAQQHPDNNLTDIFGLDDRRNAYQAGPKNSLTTFSGGGFAISYSGSLMDNVRNLGGAGQLGYGGNWYDGNREARSWGRLDLVGFTYHHSLAPLLPKEVFRKELEIFKQAWWKAWAGNGDLSDHSKGFFPTEMAYSRHLIDVLVDEGYEWVIVPSHHISRTSPSYNNVANPEGSYNIYSSPPNKADQLGPTYDSGWWYSEPNPGNAAWNVAPFAYQLHKVKYVNPETGAEKTMYAVPSDDVLSYRFGYANEGINKIQTYISPFATDPNRPVIVMPATDGDNAWGGGSSSWMEATPQFFNESGNSGYNKSMPGSFVNAAKANAPVTHIEDGAWIFPEMCYGSPNFMKWIEPPLYNTAIPATNRYPYTQADMETPGFALKFFSYAPLMAGANWCITAEQIWEDDGGSVQSWKIQAPYDWDGSYTSPNVVERAWHIYLAGLDSGFNYYGGLGNDDEVKTSLATRRATELLDSYMSANIHKDRTPPTILKPQRFPYNPGWYTFGWFNNMGTGGTNNAFLKKMPSEFYVWTHAYDVSGVSSVNLKVRLDADGVNSMSDNSNEIYAGGTWYSIPMTKRELPKTRTALNTAAANGQIDYFIYEDWASPKVADYYFAKITDQHVPGFRGKLLDYYIESTDMRTNTHKSEIQHVWVENDGQGGPSSSAAFSSDPNDCSPLTITYTASTGPLSNSVPVKMWISFTGGAPFSSYTMSHQGGGVHVYTSSVPDNAPSATVYFQNAAETVTDNRSGLNWATSIRDCDAPEGPGAATFITAPACEPFIVDYRPNNGVLRTSTQIYAHVGFDLWSTVRALQPMTKISNNVWRITLAPETNATQLDVVFNNGGSTWDNNSGADWHYALNPCLGPEPPTGFSITNPTENIEVDNQVLTFDLKGIGESVAGTLFWTNTLTGASGTALAGQYWSIASLPLGVGANIITVTGTNAGSSIITNALDKGANGYGTGFDDINAGYGFGAWQFYVQTNDANQNGRFMANVEAVNIGAPTWGLYANSGNLSEAKRNLTNALAVGQTFFASMDNGFIENGAGVGIALQNAGGDTLWEFFFNGGDTYYSISGNTTDVGWTSSGIDVEFALTGPTNYSAKITPIGSSQRIITGNLQPNADSSIRLFRAWNNFAGSGSDHDFFFNNLKITSVGSGSGISTSDTVTITRAAAGTDSNGDGVPDNWYLAYNPELDVRDPDIGTNMGENGHTLIDSYHLGVDPADPLSSLRFEPIIRDNDGQFVVRFHTVGGRQYRLEYADSLASPFTFTNLMTVTENAPYGVATNRSFTDLNALQRTSRYYRVIFLGP